MISAIITCAGNHTRFGKNKLFENIDGKPVFIRTVERFFRAKNIDEIIIPVRKEHKSVYKKLLDKEKITAILTEGGLERYMSAFNGVKTSKGDYIMVHDGARPLVSTGLIDKVAGEVKKYKAVITALRPYTCIKRGRGNFVDECLQRAETWVAQTPQAYARDIIFKAYKKAIKDKSLNGMDDCELVSSLGVKVRVLNGEENNLKITIPSDLAIIRSLYKFYHYD